MSIVGRWLCWFELIDWTPEAITAAATVALAFLTFVLAAGTLFLWLATRRLVRGTEKTAERQLRAFVFGQQFSSAPNIFDGKIKEYVFYVRWENVGLTPALAVRSWLSAKTYPLREDREVIFDEHLKHVSAPVVLGPRGTGQSGFYTIPIETLIKRWRNEIAIVIWARVEYHDIFDAKILHHHEMCGLVDLIHEPSDIPPKGHPSYVMVQFYGPQNSTG